MPLSRARRFKLARRHLRMARHCHLSRELRRHMKNKAPEYRLIAAARHAIILRSIEMIIMRRSNAQHHAATASVAAKSWLLSDIIKHKCR